MCNHNHKNNSDYGTRIEHGEAHTEHHQTWGRRQFLSTSALAALGGLFLNNVSVSALAPNPLMAAINENETDRVLVLINLAGGNDGLNMLVPYNNQFNRRAQYESYRNVGSRWSTNDLLQLGNSDMSLPIVMQDLHSQLWNNNAMSIIPNVGYANESYSHFTATKIWESSSQNDVADDRWGTGWVGRHFGNLFPAFLEAPPSAPPALQIGFNGNLVFDNSGGLGMDLTFKDPEEFYDFALSGEIYPTITNPLCPTDQEINFVRQVANNSFRYADSVKEAYNKASNDVNYQTSNNKGLAQQLAIVSRLIKGQLGTKVYLVTLGGFDNHTSVMNNQPPLLEEISESVRAFYDDLASSGWDENVVTMTYSEFGRTMDNNFNNGTDHGSLAPVFMFGPALNGGFFGDPIQLDGFTPSTNKRAPYFEEQDATDFRSIYATLLQDWLCIDGDIVDEVIGKDQNENVLSRLDLITNPCTPGYYQTATLLGHKRNVANPSLIEIRYAIRKKGNVRITLDGVELLNQFHENGSYTHYFNRANFPSMSAGNYEYTLEAGGTRDTRKMMIYPY